MSLGQYDREFYTKHKSLLASGFRCVCKDNVFDCNVTAKYVKQLHIINDGILNAIEYETDCYAIFKFN